MTYNEYKRAIEIAGALGDDKIGTVAVNPAQVATREAAGQFGVSIVRTYSGNTVTLDITSAP